MKLTLFFKFLLRTKIVFLLFLIISISVSAQTFQTNTKEIQNAEKEMRSAIDTFLDDCMINTSLDTCIEELVSKATTSYQKYIVGNILYPIDKEVSFSLHQDAYNSNPYELGFVLEYAMQLHRRGDYEEAIPHYLTFSEAYPNDYRVNVWLSDCYIHTNAFAKAIFHWKKTDHSNNHTGIDFAIHTIYGSTDQLKKRNRLRTEVQDGTIKSAYELILLDYNWEENWWNTSSQKNFIEEDIALITASFKEKETVIEGMELFLSYNKILKKNPESEEYKEVVKQAISFIEQKPSQDDIPAFSKLLYGLVREQHLDAKELFENRGEELLALATKYNNSSLLEIYANLEIQVTGKVRPEIDKKGWQEFQLENFAISYFMGLAESNTYDNPDLKQALQDFPDSSVLQWVKLNCAKIEGKDIKEDLVTLIQLEFKTLQSDRTRYSNALNSYFYYLEELL